jgi:hypothetical protein
MKRLALAICCVVGLHSPLAAQDTNDLATEASGAYTRGDYVECATLYEAVIATGIRDRYVFYNAACCHALAGNQDAAFRLLEKAVEAGFRSAGHIQRDPDLSSLREDARWAGLMASVAAAEDTHRRELLTPLQFEEESEETPAYSFCWSDPTDPYLTRLRNDYRLGRLADSSASDYETVRVVCAWVRGQWEHNGVNEPAKSDPISILEEAGEGRQFRCVEYAIVLSGALNALGIPSRVLALKTRDVETRPSGAGHVVAEAYLDDIDKWIMVDGQWDVIAASDGTPLNAVELRKALAEGDSLLGVDSFSNTEAGEYFDWILEYLFYFSVNLDNRVGVETEPDQLMLVPIGAKNPTIFQQKYPIRDTDYTHSLDVFYQPPDS